ncbi:MAG: heme-binding protein [Pseudomonadota bacterium]
MRLFPMLCVVVALAPFLAGPAMAETAEPSFTVVSKDGDFEVRRYDPMIVAHVTVPGDRGEAANRGFRVLADYIFGANRPGEKIAMTAPVIQEPTARDGQKIAMTAPVLQEPAGADTWTVTFVMPAEFTMETLPAPKSETITIEQVPGDTMAVVRFSGFNTKARLDEETQRLRAFMADKGLAVEGTPRFAFYNPPWTLPFLRRNEVMIPTN